MIDFIVKYWLEVIFGAILSGLSLMARHTWKKVKGQQEKAETEQTAMREAVLALLHDRLYSLARYYLDRRWVTIQDLDNLEYLYTAYHALGGNGTGTELFERCKALPIKPLPIAPVTEQE